jgi:hypothetical protein
VNDKFEIRNSKSEIPEDPFDRLYLRYARQALDKRLDPPARETWDNIVLRLMLSEDPERVRLYRRIEARGEDTLGGDAFDLWRKMPDYMPNRAAPVKTEAQLAAYALEHRGSMRRLMESKGLSERYQQAVSGRTAPQGESDTNGESTATNPDIVKMANAQRRIILLGCGGMMVIGVMMMVVLLIIVVKML